jgi:RsiW-degrading membrane proteinase PrsW (M82 family)
MSVQVPSGAVRAPARPHRSRSAIRVWLVAALVVTGFGLLALSVATYFGATYGVQITLLSVLAAAIPLGIVVPTFLWLDRFEAEPTRLLLIAFLWGALVAAVLAAVTNTSALAVIEAVSSQQEARAVTAVVVAPVVEESLKGLLVLLIWWRMRREFDGIIDGMVYAGITAAGFAFTENIQYLATAYSEGGAEMLGATFVLRCLFSPFAHPMFTVATGLGIGVASVSRSRWLRVLAPVLGWLLAVIGHGLWNLAAVVGGEGIITIYLLVEVPVFLGFLALVTWARRSEGRLIGRHLTAYVQAGWLSAAEVGMLASMGRRREARHWARVNTGRAGLAAMRAFQDTASELALLRRRMGHTPVDAPMLADEHALLAALVQARRNFTGLAVT